MLENFNIQSFLFLLLGHWLELVRTSDPKTPPITEELLEARKATDGRILSPLLDLALDQFLENRIIRIQIPSFNEKNERSISYIDIDLTGYTAEEVEVEGWYYRFY